RLLVFPDSAQDAEAARVRVDDADADSAAGGQAQLFRRLRSEMAQEAAHRTDIVDDPASRECVGEADGVEVRPVPSPPLAFMAQIGPFTDDGAEAARIDP